MPEGNPATPGAGQGGAATPGVGVTPELVAQVAARVYALLLADLTIERERCRRASLSSPVRGGVQWK